MTFADRQAGDDPGFQSCEVRGVVGPAVRQLCERDRRILELRFFAGW